MPDQTLRKALAGVRALVLDADGVLFLKGAAIPGAADALATFERLRIPYRVVTNFSSLHRESLAKTVSDGTGITASAERIITASSAAAAHTRARHPDGALFIISTPDARREWDGQRVLSVDEADADDADVAAVVIGDAGADLTFRELDIAFRHVRRGAELVAMHKNPWWLTRRGPTLDSGALVAGLEFATDRRSTITGKPSPVVFRQAVSELRAELAAAEPDAPRLRAADAVMVGDDPITDIAAAKRVGLRGILVLTGKTHAGDVPAAMAGRRPPDAVAASLSQVATTLAEVVAPTGRR